MKKINVVSVCFEAMIHQKFHIYAGGLGVVQAGLLKSAGKPDWPINMYGLGILWKQGYYEQKIGPGGMITEKNKMYVSRKYDFLEDTGIKVQVEINGHTNFIKVWYLRPEIFGTAPAYFLDTDLEENDRLARSITQRLYGGIEDTEETRLAQEIVLGIGGVRAFEALGITVDIWHGQEGHSTLAAIEILRKQLAAGLSFEGALLATKKQFVFTTHTPEPTGNESHSVDLMKQMGCFPGITIDQALKIGGHPSNCGKFNMSIGGFRLAKIANAVSKLHLQTACQMWYGIDGLCPFVYVTNGIDEDWQFPEFAQADNPQAMELAKEKYQERLFRYIRKRVGKEFRESILTIVWARRFTPYKRPDLIFMDWQWLKKMISDGAIQLVIAGKPHPKDLQAIHFFNWVYEKSLGVPNLAVLAGYERNQSKLLKAGADVWLFTSRRPREACSTSGMSAALNGAMNLARRDGWYDEISDEYYFSFGVDDYPRQEGEQNTIDFHDLRRVLEDQVMEMFYHDKTAWYSKTLAAKKFVARNFISDRMLKDYIEKMYLS